MKIDYSITYLYTVLIFHLEKKDDLNEESSENSLLKLTKILGGVKK